MEIRTTIIDSSSVPISARSNLLISAVTGLTSPRQTDGNGFSDHNIGGEEGDLFVWDINGCTILNSTHPAPEGPGYFRLPKDGPVDITLTVLPFSKTPRPIPEIPRSPLPPFPTPIDYRTSLPWDLPANPTRDFLRADSWGVVMPGAPPVPGTLREYDRIFSWFLDRYTKQFQHDYLMKYGGYRYSHILLSYADSCGPVDNPGKTPGNGQTLQQFIDFCGYVKGYIPYVRVRLGSKDFTPWNMDLSQFRSYFDPVIDALIAAKVVDELDAGWEWNLWNIPGTPTIDIFRYVGQRAHNAGLSSWMHFSPHVTSWFKDGDPRGRFGFYSDLQNDVDGIDYQTMGTAWDNKMLQDRMVDTLWQFGTTGNTYKMRMDEDYAFMMSDNPIPTPDDANLRGYIGCCTIDDARWTTAKVWGYGNGGRRPDGTLL
jgi:hypothetical protein